MSIFAAYFFSLLVRTSASFFVEHAQKPQLSADGLTRAVGPVSAGGGPRSKYITTWSGSPFYLDARTDRWMCYVTLYHSIPIQNLIYMYKTQMVSGMGGHDLSYVMDEDQALIDESLYVFSVYALCLYLGVQLWWQRLRPKQQLDGVD